MRRQDRAVTEPGEIAHILSRGKIVHLGLMDGERPYVVPLHYGYAITEDGRLTLYMHGAPEGRKLELIRRDPHAFVEIDADMTLISGGDVPCAYGAAYASVMGPAQVTLVEDPAEKCRALALLMKTQTGRDFPITEQMARGVAVIRAELSAYTAKAHRP